MDLRCPGKKHGELIQSTDDVMGLIEFKCSSSRFCGANPGVVVLHVFRTDTGELFRTTRFRQPRVGGSNATEHDSASVRSA